MIRRYQLKTPYRDGATHVIFKPLDFMARLAAQMPRPRVNLTRFHGVFAPNSKHRAAVTPAKRGKGNKPNVPDAREAPTPSERRATMTWAQRLKRVFGIDIETCRECGGAVNVMPKAIAVLAGQALACIEDPLVIEKKLTHIDKHEPPQWTGLLAESRAPPAGVFG